MLAFSDTVRGRIVDGVLAIEIDHPPVNALSIDVRAGLSAALRRGRDTPDVDAMVITGAGKIFIGGADIREFGQPPAEPILPAIVAAIEASAKPVVAAINGAALGGGLEVALAAHRRIAMPSATFAAPEVKLGIVPGAGGTQRLPRLIGIPAAIDLIANGRTIGAEEALKLDILDRIETGDLLAAAIGEARALMGKPLRRTGECQAPALPHEAIDTAEKKALARARGQIAPREAVRLVRLAAERPLPEGLAEERATFLRLRDSEQAAALRHVFFAERAAAKVEGLESVTPRDARTIGIVGLGLMGSGIATAVLDAGLTVIAVEQNEDAASKGRVRIEGLLDRSLQSGRIDAAGRQERLSRLSTSGDMTALKDADLIIEAVFDDLDVKTNLFQRLDDVVRPEAILATNTSYLDPDRIATTTARPERVLGLHFFSPANVMRLVEVVRCARTAPDVLAAGVAFAKRLRKLPIVCGVTEGFIGNRIFSAYRREAEFLLEDGALPHQIDAAMEEYGFAMGPFAVFDLAGLEIAWARRKRQAATRDPKERYVDIPDRLCEAGRFGQKTGRGWYLYQDGKRVIDPEVTAMIEAARAAKGLAPRAISAGEITQRLLAAMATEGTALLSEGIAARPSDIDLVMINGYGFPAHKGGPMFVAERMKEQRT
ncbi:3-hydroxyacyl-CoA dehydrogenase NAD-binding domain-containing protein [Dongia deserti]|uniref:3-hydroxyacyl-CoA dehydrogenase NAD-binding domain-containing protein n=1 Tax=Dongia deserti TaxID=2268030 RepID=UPI000E659DB7|nr:3-hydroxyacyl-CoA dehydrogenase NAD-binding domain-containing protein [Dongia deserti]